METTRQTDGQWNMQKIVVEGKKNCHVARRHKQHLVNMFVIHFVYDCFLFFIFIILNKQKQKTEYDFC